MLVPALILLTSQVLVLTSLPAYEFILWNINYRPEGRAGVVRGTNITANKWRFSFPLLSCSFCLEVFSFPRSLPSCLLLITQFSSYCQLLTGRSPVIQPAGTSQRSLPHHPTLILSVARLTIWCDSCLQSLFLPTVQELCPAQGSILFGGWVFTGRTDAEAETPVLWPPHAKSWLIGKDPDAGKDWGQEEKGTTEDEMAGWHHWLDGHEFG